MCAASTAGLRTVPMPACAKTALDDWTAAAGIAEGHLLRSMNRHGPVNIVRWNTAKRECVRTHYVDVRPPAFGKRRRIGQERFWSVDGGG